VKFFTVAIDQHEDRKKNTKYRGKSHKGMTIEQESKLLKEKSQNWATAG